ncbi:RelA/SpoT domain-containing protein [Pseudomonas aeruginosa]|uniref:RelA/SpoT domain-containing protein n=1 Tax=Pseudomonas aeruginosa TaxID=287 RepID=UPI0009A9DBE4|nr:RelA/SpoT domain-containing protein [Pseudomonas aeruginosa]MEE2473761.1 RelA/SpoT domain-containing protein [Pseudomonas aeruginosa]HBP5742024.1 (p)ppGpp synthetase [Pseudomonas aeruginosa]HCF2500932.1 RelA/SpoT domain-containing protein [Pseudomonas aeruginosa]HCF2908091.1 RelA/SpoT domain-containing protein [Pseudomonas aeruginosa]HCF2908857.1 RelA/SpoT domain-containing protein [Pseudomonas aeruginosa]
MNSERQYPGGSKSRVNKAGANIRTGTATIEDLFVIETWRAAHRAVLNTFQAILRNRTRGTRITVAQRHKRRNTIFDKLRRLPKMELSRMDDIAGCRLIFPSIEDLYSFRENFHKARFNHKRRNENDKYDYIKAPKRTGYRGIHDIYEYDVNSYTGKNLAGLYVEIQYRTAVQHAWATAVEVIGFVTESQPKFQQGDNRYHLAMAYASEILARVYEGRKGTFPEVDDREVVANFLALDRELKLMKTLKGLNSANKSVTENRNAILIFSDSGELEIKTYRDSTDALRNLFDLEKRFPQKDIVLVKADTSEEVRIAFKNYFSDARDFIEYIEQGCTKLSKAKTINRKITK